MNTGQERYERWLAAGLVIGTLLVGLAAFAVVGVLLYAVMRVMLTP